MNLGGRPPVAMVAACPFPARRGTPVRIRQMAESLAHLDYDVHVVTYHLGLDEPPAADYQIHRTREIRSYTDYSAGPNWAKLLVLDPLLTRRLLQVVRQHRISVVHAHHFEGALCALMVKRMVPGLQVIYDAHTSLADELKQYEGFRAPSVLKQTVAKILDSGIPRWCDEVVVVSERLRAAISGHGVPDSKISVVPMSVNVSAFAALTRQEARAQIGLGSEPLVVYTGNLAPIQGVDHLLRAFQHLRQRIPGARLAIVGGPADEHKALAQQLGLNDVVRFVGDLPFQDVHPWLSAANVLALPRDNCIGFPLKLLNYLASGRATVAFNGSGSEAITNGVNGLLVTDRDEPQFASALARCLENHEYADSLGREARVAASSYTQNKLSERMEALYTRLTRRARRPSVGAEA